MTTITFTKDHLEELRKSFPKLRYGDDRVTSDRTPETDPTPYNCIAWAAGDDGKWWEYDPDGELGFKVFWPEAVSTDSTIASWVKVFETGLGYKLTQNSNYERGFEKVAIYAKGSTPTHVARQIGKNRWTSKLGFGHDIEHRTLHCLSGHSPEEYGDVVRVLKRKLRHGN